jgi:hypothetical protein
MGAFPFRSKGNGVMAQKRKIGKREIIVKN